MLKITLDYALADFNKISVCHDSGNSICKWHNAKLFQRFSMSFSLGSRVAVRPAAILRSSL
ncbi:hypothetical protein CCP2SC5_160026 [Azospirillaceae bacterium]